MEIEDHSLCLHGSCNREWKGKGCCNCFIYKASLIQQHEKDKLMDLIKDDSWNEDQYIPKKVKNFIFRITGYENLAEKADMWRCYMPGQWSSVKNEPSNT
jgi:hypothetical protein